MPYIPGHGFVTPALSGEQHSNSSGGTSRPARYGGQHANSVPEISPPWAVLWSDRPPVHVYGMVDEGVAVPTGGQAQVTEVPRDRRTPFTIYTGQNAKQIPLPLLFDARVVQRRGDPSPKTIRQRIVDLNSLRRAHAESHNEPPVVKFNTGGLIDFDSTHSEDYEWWVNDVAWGERETDHRGNFISVACVVTLIAYMPAKPEKSVAKRAAKKHKRSSSDLAYDAAQRAINGGSGGAPPAVHGAGKKHRVKSHETLHDIAATELGDSVRWTEIRDLNNVADPRSLSLGSTLLLPA